jgi:serine/threonine protein kinase/tetratricopeptide (TPR) repeat protein
MARELRGEERAKFLRRECGELRQQVESLLDADARSGLLDGSTVSTLKLPEIVAGRFRVIRFIAEGGMGTVYEAHDLQLDEQVALKTIRPDIAANPRTVQRFKREITVGKSITHPNVCRIYDLVIDRSGDGAEVLYLSMQFLAGETLAARIQHGPLSTTEALPLIEDMAAGLSAAHQTAVIHRDFKSANVMLVKRADRIHAVLTDFGLARLAHDDDVRSLFGMAGTIAYMAPEQIRGEKLTPAADIYALGVVMYEMVTGQRPFTGDLKGEVASHHLYDPPQPPSELAPNLDRNWNDTILHCLNKKPAERFQSAVEVAHALANPGSLRRYRFLHAGKPTTSRRLLAISLLFFFLSLAAVHTGAVPQVGQLAVIPMLPPNGAREADPLEYGLTDTLATRLIKVSGTGPLQVVPASEIRAKGVTTLDQARQEFGVNLGLELSLRRSGDMVRVSYMLVDAKTHQELRGDTITAPITDGFAIEDRVSDSVARALVLDLNPQEREQLAEHGTKEPAAYDYYLEGWGYLQEFQKPENVDNAITLFDHALEKDPKYALAYAGLGESYWRKYELTHEKQWVDEAQKSCNKALEFDAGAATANVCLGLVYEGTGRYEDAIRQYRCAIAREPTNDAAIRGLAETQQRLGKISDAEATYEDAIRSRPNYWQDYNALGVFYFTQGRYSLAEEMFTHVTRLAPDSFRGYSNLGAAYLQMGRDDEAITALKRSIEIRPTIDGFSNVATAYFRARRYDSAIDNYSEALSLDDKDYVLWGNLAAAYHYSLKNQLKAQAAYRKAISGAEGSIAVNPRDASVYADLADYYSMIGEREKALHNLTEALRLSSDKDPDTLFHAALTHNQLGETEVSLKFLAKAIDAGYSLTNIAQAPALDNLHSNPQYATLMHGIGTKTN